MMAKIFDPDFGKDGFARHLFRLRFRRLKLTLGLPMGSGANYTGPMPSGGKRRLMRVGSTFRSGRATSTTSLATPTLRPVILAE